MIFEITPANVEKLSDEDLRELVARLCEQEVREKEFSPSTVTWGGNQNAPDGGIDVRVNLPRPIEDSYVLRQNTGFQVKAEDMSPSKIRKEMSSKEVLRDSIRDLLNNGGAYIIASSKTTASDSRLDERKSAMRAVANAAIGSKDICVDFYDQRRIASWAMQHPGVALWLRERIGEPLEGWRPFSDWSSSPGDLNEAYVLDGQTRLTDIRTSYTDLISITEGINRIRAILSAPSGVVRLVGLSGVGKTRLVQALFDGEIGTNPLSQDIAIYTDTSFQSNPTPLAILSRLAAHSRHCVLIVDNCGLQLHKELTKQIHEKSIPIGLITVEYDISDDEPRGTEIFHLESGSPELLHQVLERKYPVLSQLDIRTITHFSDGNFRVAFALAETAEHSGSLSKLADTELVERLLHQNKPHNPTLLRIAKSCSLVYSFNGEMCEGTVSEISILASLSRTSPLEFYETISELRRRKIVQSRSDWRALLPHALANRLAMSALEDFPTSSMLSELQEKAPKRLLKSFSRRLGYLHDSVYAQKIVSEWVGINGWLGIIESLNDFELEVLRNVAPVAPLSILEATERGISKNRSAFDDSRRKSVVLRLLHSIAYEPDLFDRAVHSIVLLVAEKSVGDSSDPARQTFKTLFSALLSGTHASAKQRADYLRRFFQEPSELNNSLFLAGLESMFQCTHFMSNTSPEFGSRKRDFGLDIRRSRDSCRDWYLTAIELAIDAAKAPHFREDVRNLVAVKLPHLLNVTRLTDEFSILVENFFADGGWPLGWNALKGAQDLLIESGFDDVAEKLNRLEDKLRPITLRDRIECFVFSSRHMTYGLSDSRAPDQRQRGSLDSDWTDEQCKAIGRELADDLDLLNKHLPALLAQEASCNRVNIVGIGLGESKTSAVSTWARIRSEIVKDEWSNKCLNLPCGFFYGLTRRDSIPDTAETILDEVLADDRLHQYLVRMQATLGLNSRGLARLLSATRIETVPTEAFFQLTYGKVCDALSDENLTDLLVNLCARSEGIRFALEIFGMRLYVIERSDEGSCSDTLKELGKFLLQRISTENLSHQDMRHVLQIVSECLVGEGDDVIAQEVCEKMVTGIVSGSGDRTDNVQILGALVGNFPRVVLNFLVALDSRDVWRIEHALDWSREYQPCIFSDISLDAVVEWVSVAIDKRIECLVGLMLPWTSTTHTDGTSRLTWTPLALKLIRLSPHPVDVLDLYERKLQPRSWSRPLSEILRDRLPLIEDLTIDPDERVSGWARGAKAKLLEAISRNMENEKRYVNETYSRFED